MTDCSTGWTFEATLTAAKNSCLADCDELFECLSRVVLLTQSIRAQPAQGVVKFTSSSSPESSSVTELFEP